MVFAFLTPERQKATAGPETAETIILYIHLGNHGRSRAPPHERNETISRLGPLRSHPPNLRFSLGRFSWPPEGQTITSRNRNRLPCLPLSSRRLRQLVVKNNNNEAKATENKKQKHRQPSTTDGKATTTQQKPAKPEEKQQKHILFIRLHRMHGVAVFAAKAFLNCCEIYSPVSDWFMQSEHTDKFTQEALQWLKRTERTSYMHLLSSHRICPYALVF